MTSLASTVRTVDSSSIKIRLAAHPLRNFFVLAYAGAWLAFLPLLLAQNGLGILPFRLPITAFLILGTFTGPTLAALLLAWSNGAAGGVRALLRRYLVRPSRYWWYLLAAFGPLEALVLFSSLALGGAPLDAIRRQPLPFFAAYLGLLIGGLYSGPLGEEVGWRGYALPRMQKRLGALRASLLLGALWAGWHLPLFFLPEWKSSANPLLVFVAFISWVVPFTVIMTWVYNCAHGSLLVATLLHGAANAAAGMIGAHLLLAPADLFIQGKTYAPLAVVILLATRGKLGINSFKDEVAASDSPAGTAGRKRPTPRQLITWAILLMVLLYAAVNIAYDFIHGAH
jgi:membrane protease YdiL (CAAX protease family)